MKDLFDIEIDLDDRYDIDLVEPTLKDLGEDPFDKPIRPVQLMPTRDEQGSKELQKENQRKRIKHSLSQLQEAPGWYKK